MKDNRTKTTPKVLLTVLLLILYEFAGAVPVPWVDTSKLAVISSYSLLEYMDVFNGGALSTLSFTAVGISAYITASIIIQLLSAGFPFLEELSKLPGGQKKIKKITIILGAVLSLIMSFGFVSAISKQTNILTSDAWYVKVIIAGCHCLGTIISVWIGETISEKGFCNGISLLIAINVAKSIPGQISELLSFPIYKSAIIIGVILITTLFIVLLETSELRIPTTSSKAYASGLPVESYLPIKINISGVMPIIFASTFFQLAQTIIQIIKWDAPQWLLAILTYGNPFYILISCIIIFSFTYIYSALIFKPDEIAKYLQINETAISGIRPGTDTEKLLNKKFSKINFISALYLTVLSLISMSCFLFVGYNGVQPSSLIILIGVAIEIIQKIKICTISSQYASLSIG